MQNEAKKVKLDVNKLPLILEYFFKGMKKEYVLKFSKNGGLSINKKEY